MLLLFNIYSAATKFTDDGDVSAVINHELFRTSKALIMAYFKILFISARIKDVNVF
jgi:hypothetical protein